MFTEFSYQTRKSWERERRVVAKAEHLEKGANPRFVVTSLSAEQMEARALYEELYCAPGEMENRIKEQQLALFADRTSTELMRSNQLRLYFSTFAYQLMQGLRRLGLKGTEMRHARNRGACTMSDDPLEAAENRSTDSGDGSKGVVVIGWGLSVCEDFRGGLSQLAEPTGNGLKRHRQASI